MFHIKHAKSLHFGKNATQCAMHFLHVNDIKEKNQFTKSEDWQLILYCLSPDPVMCNASSYSSYCNNHRVLFQITFIRFYLLQKYSKVSQ